MATAGFADARKALAERRFGDERVALLVESDGDVVPGLRAALLMSNKLLISENNGLSTDALIARYYLNEVGSLLV